MGSQSKFSLFSLKIDETIINYMKNNETAEKPEKYPFAELSKIIHIDGIDAKKIADRWWNILDPRLCKEPLSQKEKKYIYSRVPQLIRPQQKINWKGLQEEMKAKFEKFRSRNSLKNNWYSKQRQNGNTQASNANPIPPDDDESDEEEVDELHGGNETEIQAGDGIEAGASNKADDNIEAGASNKASIDYMMN